MVLNEGEFYMNGEIPPSSRFKWSWLGAGLVVALFILLWLLQSTHDRRVLLELPEAERKALYDRSMETLRTVCLPPLQGALIEFCKDQAELVSKLPECDGECQHLLQMHSTVPTR